jgi:hypothetical protein
LLNVFWGEGQRNGDATKQEEVEIIHEDIAGGRRVSSTKADHGRYDKDFM